ncbi:hypothetical protein FHX76_001329 [Lysinibacter cavernae]|uniref:Uncharacterized protein n=1 Tax=Lysinibacter cavernae TaxID=1640652 RepID=A0A7X5R0R0_9MICO|nr:hypothetical protein [Lysinibacter cavernae]
MSRLVRKRAFFATSIVGRGMRMFASGLDRAVIKGVAGVAPR